MRLLPYISIFVLGVALTVLVFAVMPYAIDVIIVRKR